MTFSTRFHRLLRFVTYLVVLAISSSAAYAQNADITGAILDPQGAAIPGASVTVTNESTDVHRETLSTKTGDYDIPALVPGNYTIRVQKSGFQTMERTGIALYVATVTRLDLRLVVGHQQETVTVSADTPLLQSTDATVGQVIENKHVVTIPLNGRSYTQLAALAPGTSFGGTNVGKGSPSGIQIQNPTLGINGFFTISGSRIDGNNFTLNGVTVTAEYDGGTSAFPPIDSIQEFKLLQNNYDAEFGFHTGQVVVVTKSGTNAFHGSAYEFLRNDALDAANYFARTSKNTLKQNQFGASLGGPVLLPGYSGRSRTFFFVNYEGARVRSGTTTTTTVPTTLMRQGNFSELSKAVINPQTGKAFPGNTIPTVSPIALSTIRLAQYPLPNLPGLVNNYTLSPVTSVNQDEVLGRVDHDISQKDRLWGSVFWEDLAQTAPRFTEITPSSLHSPVKVFTADETHIFSPTLLNDLKGGWSYINWVTDNTAPKDVTNVDLGFPQNENQPMAVGISAGIPEFLPTGYGSLGAATGTPNLYKAEHYQIADFVTWSRRDHTLKFGGDFIREHEDLEQGTFPRGQYFFNGQYSGNGFADFLLGLPSSATRTLFYNGQPVNETRMRAYHFALFAQDNWRVNRKLTLNVGLRYQKNNPPVEADDHATNVFAGTVNGAPGIVTIYAPDPKYGRCLCISNNGELEPRIGVAYQINPKTVFRGGYSIVHNFRPANDTSEIGNQQPWLHAQSISNTNPGPVFDLENAFLPNLVATAAGQIITAIQAIDNRIQQWTVGMQRDLGQSFVLEADYLGSSSDFLDVRSALNAAHPGPGSFASRRPYPTYSAYTLFTNDGTANYQAGTVQIKRTSTKGLTLLAHYTWSKSQDDSSNEGDSALQNPEYDLHSNWGLSGFNIAHRFVASAVYELPIGRRKALLSGAHGPINLLVSGWQVAPVYTAQSGFPFSPTTSSNTANSESGVLRPDQIGNISSAHRSRFEWFNTAAFAQPAPYKYGNARRNNIIGPNLKNLDLALIKETPVSERIHVQFRGEFFNAFNNVNFGTPNATFGTTSFGTISTIAGNNREIQFGLKVLF
jgi:hypothetical protein